MRKKTVVLAILDGWGIGKEDGSNPIYGAGLEHIPYIKRHYPIGSLQASGIAVGLPWHEEGNSEVGHLTIGAGKVFYQHYPRISIAIQDGSFFKNEVLQQAFDHAQANNSNVNLVGLLTEGNVHAAFEHLTALIQMAERAGILPDRINLHLFTDGKDSGPQAAPGLLERLGNMRVTSLSGRYFAMDQDLQWERTERVYDALTRKNQDITATGEQLASFLGTFYERGLTDEFVEPTLLLPNGAVKEGDSIVFFNFREDGARQLAELFAKSPIPSTYVATFTKYGDKLRFPVAFPQEKVVNPFGKVLADNGKIQFRIAETVKYAHITYFFNGLREEPLKNEYRALIPSRNIARHDEAPEMRAEEITTRAVGALEEGAYDFILVNYANPDIIGHTGNYDAAVTAARVVDIQIKRLMEATLAASGTLVITSDHGNIERMLDPRTGVVETTHDPSPVPLYVVAHGYELEKDDAAVKSIERENAGVLSDIAPTILELMGIRKPEEMTGISLLGLLK